MTIKIETKTKRNALLNARQIAKADRFALQMKPVMLNFRSYGYTYHQIAEMINEVGARTQKGHFWAYKSVRNIYERLDAIAAREAADAAERELLKGLPQTLRN